jgi:hypothetical protein
MSDDDLWRPKEPSSDDPASETSSSGEQPPSPPVSDETQPITGSSGPAPAPPGPPYQPPSPGAVPPPQNPYGAPGPYGAPPSPNPYGDPQGQPYAPPPNPYPAPNEYAAPQNPYGVPFQPAYAGGALPDHPSATTSMVLGIVGLVGIFLCGGLTLILSPVAWVVGAKAVREIDATPGRYGGRDKAQGGKVMGIIGSIFLVLGIIAIIGFVALAASVGSNEPTPTGPQHGFLNG